MMRHGGPLRSVAISIFSLLSLSVWPPGSLCLSDFPGYSACILQTKTLLTPHIRRKAHSHRRGISVFPSASVFRFLIWLSFSPTAHPPQFSSVKLNSGMLPSIMGATYSSKILPAPTDTRMMDISSLTGCLLNNSFMFSNAAL